MHHGSFESPCHKPACHYILRMPLIDPEDPRPVHFVGIAGAGMSALAELLVRRGATVTGCDNSLAGAADLERLGLALQQGPDPRHVEGARAVVVTSAVPKNHPELERARTLGIPVIRRAEALGEAVAGTTLVAVAGTHGKTTTTVLTTEALRAAGIDATGVVGGVFYGKASIYLRAMGRELPGDWQAWIG